MFWGLLRLNSGLSLSHILTTIGKHPVRADPQGPLPYVLCFRRSSPLPRASLVVQTVKRETWVRSLVWEDPLEEGMPTHSSILAWRTHGQRRLAGYSPYHPKELDTTKATEQARMQNWLAMLQLWDLSLEGVSPPALCLCGAWGYSERRPCTWTTLELWILKCLPCLTLVLALLCSSASLLAAVRWGVAHLHSPGLCCFLDFVLEPMTESSASVSIILFLWLHLYNSKLCQPQWPLCPQGWGVGEGAGWREHR